MADSLPFYYKCNFRITKNSDAEYLKKNAFIDYMTRNPEFNTEDYMANGWCMPNGTFLDENGAKALLDNERFIDKSMSKTMYETVLNDDIHIDVDFCDFSHEQSLNKSYLIQLINKDKTTVPQMGTLEFNINNENGGNILEIKKTDVKNFFPKELKEQIKAELLKAVEIKAKELNARVIEANDNN